MKPHSFWSSIAAFFAVFGFAFSARAQAKPAFNELYEVVKQLETKVINAKGVAELRNVPNEPLFECGGDGTCRIRYSTSTLTRRLVPDKFFSTQPGTNTTGLRWHFKAWDNLFYLAVGSCTDDQIYEVRMESYANGNAFLPPVDQVKIYSRSANPGKWSDIAWNAECPTPAKAPLISPRDAFTELHSVVQKLEVRVNAIKELRSLPEEPLFECGGNGECRVRYSNSPILRSLVPEKFFSTQREVNTTGLRWKFTAWNKAFYLAVGSCTEDEIYEVKMESYAYGNAYLPSIDDVKVYSRTANPEKWDAIVWNSACK